MSDSKNDKGIIKVKISRENIGEEPRDFFNEYQQLDQSMSKLRYIYRGLFSLRKIRMKSLLYSFSNDKFDIFKYAEMNYAIKLEAERTWPSITGDRIKEAKMDFDPTAGPVITKRVNTFLHDLYNNGRKPFDIEISKQRNEEKEERTRYYIKAQDMIEALALFSFYEGKSYKSYESEVFPKGKNIRPKFSSQRSMSKYAYIKVVEQMNYIIEKYNRELDTEGNIIDNNEKLYFVYCTELIDDMFCVRGLAAFNAMIDWITSDNMMDSFMKSGMLSYNEMVELKDSIKEFVLNDSQFVTRMIKYWKTGYGYAFESYIRDIVISMSMGFNIDMGIEGVSENVVDERYPKLSGGIRYVALIIEEAKVHAERCIPVKSIDKAIMDNMKDYPTKEILKTAENDIFKELRENKLFEEIFCQEIPTERMFKYLNFDGFKNMFSVPPVKGLLYATGSR